MRFAVKDTRERLDLPQLSQAEQDVPLEGRAMQLRDVSFSYGGQDGKAGHTDLHHFFVISFIIVQIGIISTGISL